MWLSVPRGMLGVQALLRRPLAPASLLSWHVPSQKWWRMVSLNVCFLTWNGAGFCLEIIVQIRSYLMQVIKQLKKVVGGYASRILEYFVFSAGTVLFLNVHLLSPWQTDWSRGEALCLLAGVLENMGVLAPPSGWRWEMKHFGHEVFPTALILIDRLMRLSLVLEHFNIIFFVYPGLSVFSQHESFLLHQPGWRCNRY